MDYILTIYIVSAVGFVLSAYSYYIEWNKQHKAGYKAICDINDKLSCTKTFTSEYGKVFGIPNSLSGIGYYAALTLLLYFNYVTYAFYLSILSLLFTIYLAYASYFKLKTYCVICHSIYIVNIFLVVFLNLAR